MDDPPPDPTLPPCVASASPTLRSGACVHANLFCGPDHLDAWRHAAGDPPSESVTLAEVPALARRAWADIAAGP